MASEVVDTLEPTPRAPARARELVRTLEAEDSVRRTVELIVSELVTNSVVHTDGEPADVLRVRLRCKESGVEGEVCDRGGGFEWEAHAPDLGEPGGLGLMLVDQLAADWGVRSNGCTCVWFECAEA
jgi:anti-sigma regulatory factor (Ser/Thr protein kinase)